MKKQTKKILLISSIIIVIGVILYFGVLQSIFPNQLQKITLSVSSPSFDGYDWTVHLSTFIAAGANYNNYIFEQQGDLNYASTTGSWHDCVEKGATTSPDIGYRCYMTNGFESGTLTLSRVIFSMQNGSIDLSDKLRFSGSDVIVDLPSLPADGTLTVDFIKNIVCRIGDTKCDNNKHFICQSITRNYDYYEQWTGTANVWILLNDTTCAIKSCTIGTHQSCTTANGKAGTQECKSGNGIGIWDPVCTLISPNYTLYYIIGGILLALIILYIYWKKR